VTVAPGALVDFNTGLGQLGSSAPIPPSYQPVSGLTIGYTGVGLLNYGPDHTTGIPGVNHYNTYQYGTPQVFTFSVPVSIPSVWLTTLTGGGQAVTITAYSATNGTAASLLGANLFSTPVHPNGSSYIWAECTNLNSGPYNGLIRRVEFTSRGNAQLDDMLIIPDVSLSIVLEAGSVMVSWPASASGLTLEASTELGVNASWVAVGSLANVVGANYQVTIPVSANAQFFRLR
jgi:hypothetical protein